MIPLRDDQPTSTFPIVTILLIALNVVVYLAQNVLPGFDNSFEMVPYEITHHHDLIGALQLAAPTDAMGTGQRSVTLYYGPSPHPLWLTVFTPCSCTRACCISAAICCFCGFSATTLKTLWANSAFWPFI